MPIYEYRCTSCGFEKEYLQKLSDAPISVCESCGKPSMTKLVSAAGFQLKGSGWYVTDFKNSGGKDKAAGKSEGEAKGGASGAAPSDKPSGDASSAESKPAGEAKSSGESKTSSDSSGSKDAKSTTGPASSGTSPNP